MSSRWIGGVFLLMLAAALAAPVLSSTGRPEALALYAGFSSFCHQRPERAFQLLGEPVAVCARCLGAHAGFAQAAIAGVGFSRRRIAAAAAAVGLSVVVESFTNLPMSPWIHFGTGLALGLSIGAALTLPRLGRAPWRVLE